MSAPAPTAMGSPGGGGNGAPEAARDPGRFLGTVSRELMFSKGYMRGGAEGAGGVGREEAKGSHGALNASAP